MSDIANQYDTFAIQEARGISARYEEFALGVAGDAELIALLDELPPGKRQPNLLFAAVRFVAGEARHYPEFRRLARGHWGAVSEVIRARRTQTNEAARCAALYPVLARLPQPLALLEVGASAGLCLLPDRYAYDYGFETIGDRRSPVVLRCAMESQQPTPDALRVAWRRGIDLNPIDLDNTDDVRWLEALIWPEHTERLDRLRNAITVARRERALVVSRNLVDSLGEVAADVPRDATLVVFHTATLCYVAKQDREAFPERVKRLGARWVSQEGPGVFPRLDPPARPRDTATFTLALDGRPVAFTAPHGGWLRWIADPSTIF
jgi:hypothetical protein